ncbi:MAG TPA: helix-turn-helix domain-containing protein [Syntrophobacteraceae bacterium]|nr:helix-turn-helix domain-containing protein [Syntrophobacteraceae bacterium]
MRRDNEKPKESSPDDSSAYERIVAAARRIFFANGFRRVTMDDLARELGMSKKTLYEHFPSKTALVEAAILHKFQAVDSELQRISSECSSDFLGTLRDLLAYIQQQMGEIQPPFLRDIKRQPELFSHVEARRRELVQRYFGGIISQGRKAGLVRQDVPAELITEIILASFERIMIPSKMAELEITPRAGFSAIVSVILEGVITRNKVSSEQ